MFNNQNNDNVPPLPELPIKTPQLSDFFKIASNLMNGSNENEEFNSPLSFMNSPEFSQTVENMTRGLLQSLSSSNFDSKINLKSEMNRNDCNNESNKTKDLVLELPVTLEELYRGKNKKVTVKRKRSYEQSDGTFKIVEERKQIVIEIEKGSRNDQRIVFPNEADELPGFETGDVIVVLKEQENSNYIRCFDDLMINLNISISELFYFDTVLKLLDGTDLRVKNTSNDLLSECGYIRKIIGKGMPIPSDPNNFGDLFIQFNVVPQCDTIPSKDQLRLLFPPINNISNEDENKTFVELSTLEDDDFYKLDLFEEDELTGNDDNDLSSDNCDDNEKCCCKLNI